MEPNYIIVNGVKYMVVPEHMEEMMDIFPCFGEFTLELKETK